MQRYVIFLLCFCFYYFTVHVCFAEVITLKGKISLNFRGGQPVQGVQVTASSGASPTESNTSGLFDLKFSKKKPGAKVLLIVTKPGFEVVNRFAQETILRAKPEDLVEIIICKTGERNYYAVLHYQIILEQIANSEYDKDFKEIKGKLNKLLKTREEKEHEIKKLYDQLASLETQRDTALARSKELAEKLAEENLDEVSELYKKAFGYFQNGEIEKALEVLDDAKMEAALRKVQQEEARIKQKEAKIKQKKKEAIGNFMLKAQLLIASLEFDRAEVYYQKAVKADETNLENVIEFANYLTKQRQFPRAQKLYEKALSVAKNEYDVAGTLNNLGTLYSDTNAHAQAREVYERALEIYEKLARDNPKAYLPYVATTLNNLGTLYSDTNAHAQAREVYERALEIYEKLARDNPKAYLPDVAMTLNNLGILYRNTNAHAQAREVYERALEIREKLAHENPKAYEIELSNTIIGTSKLYASLLEIKPEQSYKDKGLALAQRAVTILEKYPDVYKANQYKEYAVYLRDYFENVSVENLKLQSEALSLVRKAEEILQNNGSKKEAKEHYEKAISLYTTLTKNKRNPEDLYLLSGMYEGLNNIEEDNKKKIENQKKILALREEIYQAVQSQEIKQSLASAHGVMAWYLLFDRAFKEAGEHAQKGLDLDPSQEWINTNLALAYLFTGQYEKAEAIYRKFKDKPLNENTSFRETFLKDFKELEEAGITHRDSEKIRLLLGK
jgi:tetratricopeptide (TPR) repeat protein